MVCYGVFVCHDYNYGTRYDKNRNGSSLFLEERFC